MPLADIIKLEGRRMTSQEIADMALSEDRAARAARRRGDHATAQAHDDESAKLCTLLDR